MKKLLFFSCLLFCACEIDFEDNSRLFFNSTIVDQNGEPVSGIEIVLSAGGTCLFCDFEIIGSGVTDASGRAYFPVLDPKTRPIDISVNEEFGSSNYKPNYSRLKVSNVTDSLLTNQTIRLPQEILYKLAPFNLVIQNTSGTTASMSWELYGPREFETIDFSSDEADGGPTFSGSLNGSEIFREYSLNLAENINYTFTYRIIENNSSVSEGEITITNTENTREYVFEY